MSKLKCSNCEHWERLQISNSFLPEDAVGECVGLLARGIEIDLFTGLDGGGIETIETSNLFFCANFKESKE